MSDISPSSSPALASASSASANTTSISTNIISQSPSSNIMTSTSSVQTKRLFAECALVEIIHLHDCLRGALQQINRDVDSLVAAATFIDDEGRESEKKTSGDEIISPSSFDINVASDLSNSVASRFHLIWSVFQAHSGAEDEFIWPALKMKIESKKKTRSDGNTSDSTACSSNVKKETSSGGKKCGCESFLEQEAYEEDHAEEETMFKQINTTLRRLNGSFRFYHSNRDPRPTALSIIKKVILLLKEQTDQLTQHLTVHLEKEETQCLPMVKKHLSNEEISELVGNIMGKRSAELMGKILNLAVCSLPGDERDDMVRCLKKAMGGTFFEKWLTMGGWNGGEEGKLKRKRKNSTASEVDEKRSASPHAMHTHATGAAHGISDDEASDKPKKMPKFQGHITDARMRNPSRYYVRNDESGNELIWNSAVAKRTGLKALKCVPVFTQSELTPTFEFSESRGAMVLGCEHYSRSCKLRHPETGQLFTCRLCCEEIRQSNTGTYESLPVLDRHAVSEVLCMKCGSLQPVGKNCVNKDCEAADKPFAKYFCSICNLYDDDETKDIYHCPYCNVCRKGKGLGIDFRHCMRCNACIGMSEYETHACIPQRLSGNCAICKESMFESTEPLRGMKCGHVMHLSCYNEYAHRSLFMKITCPTCRKVFDNMRG
mmetsp:Transcript_25651/g.39264  ORF Transcript_25651/g.39264 Transcript_25651/m.39264 type:complete len:660 (-) Transcript_25651:128-2107(-)